MPEKLIIRTSDRGTFKKCRQLWDFTSKIRMDYEPNVRIRPLDMGTAIHRGLEVYHDLATWQWRYNPAQAAVLIAKAVAAFRAALVPPTDLDGSPTTDPELLKEWNDDLELGAKMIKGYHEWSLSNDTYEPVATELEFEVSVPCHYHDVDLPPHFRNVDGTLYYRDTPVVYQGRIDLLLKDKLGRYWIKDFKTAAKFDNVDWLDLDPQCISYGWAVGHVLKIDIAGVIYEQLRKGAPGEPKLLKSGKFSQDKSQEVTYKTYKQALDRSGQSVVGYEEFLSWLQDNEKQYFRQIQITHTHKEYEIISSVICNEAMDMLGAPRIYPAPTAMNCNGCKFRPPCQARMGGDDWQWILDEMYHQRGNNGDVESVEALS